MTQPREGTISARILERARKGAPSPAIAKEVGVSPQYVGAILSQLRRRGVGFTPNGFGNWFRDRCDEAGLPECSAHGLRKAGATRAAEQGATVAQLMAIYGWSSPKQAVRYTEAANRKRLAADGVKLLARTQSE